MKFMSQPVYCMHRDYARNNVFTTEIANKRSDREKYQGLSLNKKFFSQTKNIVLSLLNYQE